MICIFPAYCRYPVLQTSSLYWVVTSVYLVSQLSRYLLCMSGVSGSGSARSSEHARTRSGGSAPDCGGRGGGDRSLRGSLRDNLRLRLLISRNCLDIEEY